MIVPVTSTSPLEVQLPGATTATPATLKASTLPGLSIGDRVDVEIDPVTRDVVVFAKLVAA